MYPILSPDPTVIQVINQVSSGVLVSGLVTQNYLAAESVRSGHIGSGAVVGNGIAGKRSIASGTLDRIDFNSGTVVDYFACEQAISGIRAVAWGSGACFIVPAERRSGFRLPAVGVTAGNYASGDIAAVVRHGRVGVSFSGGYASGVTGYLYVGSGGLLVNLSGFMAGASSGNGPNPTLNAGETSGCLVQSVAVALSGGLYVQLDNNVRSGLLSGLLGAY
jgi:hypothetical protein